MLWLEPLITRTTCQQTFFGEGQSIDFHFRAEGLIVRGFARNQDQIKYKFCYQLFKCNKLIGNLSQMFLLDRIL